VKVLLCAGVLFRSWSLAHWWCKSYGSDVKFRLQFPQCLHWHRYDRRRTHRLHGHCGNYANGQQATEAGDFSVLAESRAHKIKYAAHFLPITFLFCILIMWFIYSKHGLPTCFISFLSILILHSHHRHHHRQLWAQCPLVSDTILTIAAHHCLSRAAWLNSCRVVPHHCSMSSDHSLFEPSIIPNTRVFIFLLSFILQIWPKRRNFVSLFAVGFLSIESFCTILH